MQRQAETLGETRFPVQPVLLLWICVAAALVYSGWSHIADRSGWDPDDQLRLVQLRDFLGGQSWFDSTQYRMNAPEGAPMHWSRLIELPLALIVLLLTPIFGQAGAEIAAGVFVPLAGLGLVAYLLGKATMQIASREAGLVAAGIALISPMLLLQFRPMRIDHHGWQIVMAALALSALFWPSKKRGGITIGLALAVWLHISLEGAPMAAAFFVLLGWRWIFQKAQGQRLLWSTSSFALGTIALFFATQKAGLMAAVYCDTVSPPHLAAVAIAAIVMIPAILAKPKDSRMRFGAAVVAGICAVAVLLLLSPECAGGAFGNLDKLVHDYWYVNINEGMPAWYQDKAAIIGLMAAPFVGLFSLYLIRDKFTGKARVDFGSIGFLLIYALLLSCLVFRTVSVATVMAVPPIAILIVELFQRYRRNQVPAQRIGLVAAILALLLPGGIGVSVLAAFDGPETPAKSAKAKHVFPAGCERADSVTALGQLQNARILAPFDMTPMILMTTPHQVLASSHHRNEVAMHDHIATFIAPPDEARVLLRKRGITHIAACMDEAELKFYAKRNPYGLWAHLAAGKTPFFLEQMTPLGKGIQVWRVRF